VNLADATDNAAVRDLFLVLAQEEAKHKLRFELEYDEHILKEN
jgi:rubrerythrin